MGGDASKFKTLSREQILTLYEAGPEAVISLVEYLQSLAENFQDNTKLFRQEIEKLKDRLREVEEQRQEIYPAFSAHGAGRSVRSFGKTPDISMR
jgi:predicted  nucleic acid-binding Zn-ribbon protein